MSYSRIVSEYDQEIPQSQTANNPMAPRGRATQPPLFWIVSNAIIKQNSEDPEQATLVLVCFKCNKTTK